MFGDKIGKFLARLQSDDFDPEKGCEVFADDEFFYAQQLLEFGLYAKGLKVIANLLRTGQICSSKYTGAGEREFIAEMLDPQRDRLNFRLIPKKTNQRNKYFKIMNDEIDLSIAVQAVMEAEKINKTKAISKIAPGRERQANRAIAAVRKRRAHLLRFVPTDKK
jgi:hypothetical protein